MENEAKAPATQKNISIRSKAFKSYAWKVRKREMHRRNKEQRAQLHRQIANGNAASRDALQRQVDEISLRS